MRFRTLAFGTFILTAAADVSAQTCLGLASFSEGPYQASLGVAFTDGAQGFAGGAALGSENVFAGATLGFTNVSDADSGVTAFAANAGATFVVNEQERVEACPVASVIISRGPDVADVDVKGVGLRAGGRLGIVAVESGSMEVIPTFGLDIAYDRTKLEVGAVETTARETYAIVRAGVGFILNKRISLLPSLGVPLGLDGADPEFSFVAAYNFGNR